MEQEITTNAASQQQNLSLATRHKEMPAKGMWEYFKECMTTKYCSFSGRARRKEFFGFLVIFYALAFLCCLIAGLFSSISESAMMVGIVPLIILTIATIIPRIAVEVRRFHDTGRGGGWIFIACVPYIGGIIALILLCGDSEYENRFGDSPKYKKVDVKTYADAVGQPTQDMQAVLSTNNQDK